jgi:hypothetical protein
MIRRDGPPQTIDYYIEVTAYRPMADRTRLIYIAYDEWNVWYRTYNRKAGRDQ